MLDPVITNRLALQMMLRRFAQHLGISDVMSDVTSQAFMQIDSGIPNWDAWLRKNCTGCDQSPDTCSMLNPPGDQIPGGLTPEQFVSGQIHIIESGRIRDCPRKG